MKNAIRYVYFVLCEWGLASPEVECKTGTLKHKWLVWLYGQDAAVPMFATQWPEDEKSQ